MIIITKKLLKELFALYNAAYFNNELQTPAFGLIDGFECAGRFTCRHYRETGKVYRPKIYIAYNIEWCEESLRSVLVHEMIHYYVNTKSKYPTNGDFQHFGLFWWMKMKLNIKYNLHIRNTYKHLKYIE